MQYTCKKCNWSGEVTDKRKRCRSCDRTAIKNWRKNNPKKYAIQRARKEKKFRTERRDEYNAKRRRIRSKQRMSEARERRVRWLISGDVRREQLIELYEKRPNCFYCGQPVMARFSPLDPRGFDHVIPRAKNGKHTISNMVVACGSCNAIKSDN